MTAVVWLADVALASVYDLYDDVMITRRMVMRYRLSTGSSIHAEFYAACVGFVQPGRHRWFSGVDYDVR